MPLGLSAVRTFEMRAAAAAVDAFDAACAENRATLGTVGNEAFHAGAISREGLVRLLAVTLPHWRASSTKPHKGCLVLRTSSRDRRLSHRHLVDFFVVEASTPEQRSVSARTIQRVLQVIGAAHYAAGGDGTQIANLLLALIEERGSITPAGLLVKAKKQAWGAPLRTDETSAAAERARILRKLRASMDQEAWPRATLEALQAEIARAFAQQREVGLRVASSSDPSLAVGAGRTALRRGTA